ncbi:TPA: hypothetical protein NW742_003530, partial [Acinetobacter baumannii]|nr:hypothetical protein [Acinetobacter baumannii]HCK0056061.1 hypothetical protein [Acinetobacter baumannii]
QKGKMYSLLYAFLILIISYYFVPLYIYGDQQFYIDFYDNCFYPSVDSFECYNSKLGTQEPLYFGLVWVMNKLGVDRNIFIIFSNAVFAYLLCANIFKYYKVSFTRNILSILLLTNYYSIVLLFAAERLKFGVIFVLLYLLATSKYKVLYYFLAMVGHIQSFFFSFYVFLIEVRKLKKLWLKIAIIISMLGVGGIFLFFLSEHISHKVEAYSGEGGSLGSIIKTIFFIILSYLYSKNFKVLLCGIPLIAASFVLDVERVAIFAFFVFIGAFVYYKKPLDPLLILILLYFSMKSIEFLINIINFGSGYI